MDDECTGGGGGSDRGRGGGRLTAGPASYRPDCRPPCPSEMSAQTRSPPAVTGERLCSVNQEFPSGSQSLKGNRSKNDYREDYSAWIRFESPRTNR